MFSPVCELLSKGFRNPVSAALIHFVLAIRVPAGKVWHADSAWRCRTQRPCCKAAQNVETARVDRKLGKLSLQSCSRALARRRLPAAKQQSCKTANSSVAHGNDWA